MTDAALEAALFAAVGTKQGHRRQLEPDWSEIHASSSAKHVTLAMPRAFAARRGSETARAGQHQGGRHQGLPL